MQQQVTFQQDRTTDLPDCLLSHTLELQAVPSCQAYIQRLIVCRSLLACPAAGSMAGLLLCLGHCIVRHTLQLVGYLMWTAYWCRCHACTARRSVFSMACVCCKMISGPTRDFSQPMVAQQQHRDLYESWSSLST